MRDDPETRHTITAAWEARSLAQRAVTTFGANGTRGVPSRFGGTMPRASGGFTVYRPDHWSLAGTDLYYGDVFCAGTTEWGYALTRRDVFCEKITRNVLKRFTRE